MLELVTFRTSCLQIFSVAVYLFLKKSHFLATGYNQPLTWGRLIWDWGMDKVRAQSYLEKAQWVGKM